MEKQTNDAKRAELSTEYKSNLKKNEMRLDELSTANRTIEECRDELSRFQQNVKYMLEYHQSELALHDSHEDLKIFHQVEEEMQSNCYSTEHALLDEKEENERKRKQIFRDREDIEQEYKRAIFYLNESER